MRWFALAIATLLCVSTIPASSAGGDGVHWNGYNLDRPAIPNRVLVDQDGNNYSIQKGTADVIVVAFIFTTCADVCPVITNNLLQAEKQLDDIDSQFISITVDPATDSPEVLNAYMEEYGATWPHLTGEIDDLELVWGDFQVSVFTEEIESPEHHEVVDGDGNMSEHDDHNGNGDMGHEDSQTVTVIMPDGNSTEYQVQPTGWDLLTASAYQNNWSVSPTPDSFGNMVSAINGDESPSDSSWRWELHTWNMSGQVWEPSLTGIDSAEPTNLAFAPNTTDDSLIPMPDMSNISFTIVQSDGTNDTAVLDRISAWHQSLAALDEFEASTSQYGHFMNSISNVNAPSDYSWWWQLHHWNMTSGSWEESALGMDELYDMTHIAWAPNSTMDHMIPSPQMMQNSHGEEMIHKLGVVYPDGTTAMFDGAYTGVNNVSAMEHTMVTLQQNAVEHDMANGSAISIDGIPGEYDLYIWHDMGGYSHWMSTSDSASESILMVDAEHYAWIAKGGNASTLMSPEIEHNSEEENETTTTSTSHSTQTFILDEDWNPMVVFLGYDWNVDDFVQDVERAANTANTPDLDDDSGLPGFTFVTVAASLGLAIIAMRRDD
jgi:cytochrome oxidase Cu insertion factor (SCO1/SenC/PrrC family)